MIVALHLPAFGYAETIKSLPPFLLLKFSVNGAWTTWSSWSQCSATCKDGLQESYRACTDPEPQYGGDVCLGEATRLLHCIEVETCPGKLARPIGRIFSFFFFFFWGGELFDPTVNLLDLTTYITTFFVHFKVNMDLFADPLV